MEFLPAEFNFQFVCMLSYIFSWQLVYRADNLTSFLCRLSWNLGASPFRNPQGVSRPCIRIALPYTFSCHVRQTASL